MSATEMLGAGVVDLAKASPEELQAIANGSDVAWASLSDAERATMQALHDKGVAPPATTPALNEAELLEASLTAEDRAVAEAGLKVPANLALYKLPDPPAGIERLTPEDDTQLRHFCLTNELDQREASWVTTEVYRAGKQLKELASHGDPSTLEQRTTAAINLSGSAAQSELRRQWGDAYDANLATAKAEFARMRDAPGVPPEIVAILTRPSPLLNSVPLIRLLFERAGRRGGKA